MEGKSEEARYDWISGEDHSPTLKSMRKNILRILYLPPQLLYLTCAIPVCILFLIFLWKNTPRLKQMFSQKDTQVWSSSCRKLSNPYTFSSKTCVHNALEDLPDLITIECLIGVEFPPPRGHTTHCTLPLARGTIRHSGWYCSSWSCLCVRDNIWAMISQDKGFMVQCIDYIVNILPW